jgi:hypothetical protein
VTEKNKHSLRKKIWTTFFALETSLANPPGSETKPNLALRPKGGPGGPWGLKTPNAHFLRKLFFFLLPINWVLKNNPNESKKPKKICHFLIRHAQKTPKMVSGSQWSAAGPLLTFRTFSGPKFTIL